MRTAAPLLTAIAALGILTTPSLAQNKTVFPAANAKVEGNTFDLRPFGLERVRLTQLIPLNRLGIGRGKQITEIAYRRDNTILRTRAMTRTRTTSWSIRLGNINSTVAAGRAFNPRNPTGLYLRPGSGTNSLVEYYNATPAWPSLLPNVGGVAPFALRFKLRRAFVVQGPSGIAVDHYMYGARGSTYAYYIDAVRGDVDRGKATEFGDSCPKTANRAYAIPSNPGGEPLELQLFGAKPSSLVTLIIGTSRSSWSGLKLPFALDPLGLKGCSLYNSHDILLPMFAQTTGSARVFIPIPADSRTGGAKVYTQWMVWDNQLSNAIPFTFSNGVDITIGKTIGPTPLDVSVLYGAGNNAVIRGRYGLVDRGFMPVTEFTHN